MGEILDMGSYKMYMPAGGSTIVALYADGVYDGYDISKGGVTLGYYSHHGHDVDDGTIDMATRPPDFSAEWDDDLNPRDKWHSYELTQITELRNPDEMRDSVDSMGVAVAYVTTTTHTADIVRELSQQGFTEIRGVHCRGVPS